MSVIVFQDSIAGAAIEAGYLELGRPFIHAVTLQAFSAAALAALLEVRISSRGLTIAPTSQRGSSASIYLDNHYPVRLELKKEMTGPPYEVEIQAINNNAGAVILVATFEVYNTPYPQTRIYVEPVGTEEQPFNMRLLRLQTMDNEKQETGKNGR